MQPRVNIEVHIDEANREVAVAGELDVATRFSVTDAAAQLNVHGDGDINLDLNEVTFIDAAGVGSVVAAGNEQAKRHTALNVRSSSRAVRRVFSICKLEWMLTTWTRFSSSATPAPSPSVDAIDDAEEPADLGPQTVLRAHIAQLELALKTNRRISVAVGILMATRRLPHDAAYQVLATESQNSNRKLVDVADAVIHTNATL